MLGNPIVITKHIIDQSDNITGSVYGTGNYYPAKLLSTLSLPYLLYLSSDKSAYDIIMDKKFMIKYTSDINKSINEAIIGLLGTNKLRSIIPNFIYLYGVVTSGDNSSYYLLYEAISAKTLEEYCNDKPNPDLLLTYYIQIVLAIYNAEIITGYTHYNLTPDNILLRSISNSYISLEYNYNGKKYPIITDSVATIINQEYSRISYDEAYYGLSGYESFGVNPDRSAGFNDVYKLLHYLNTSADWIEYILNQDISSIDGLIMCLLEIYRTKSINTIYKPLFIHGIHLVSDDYNKSIDIVLSKYNYLSTYYDLIKQAINNGKHNTIHFNNIKTRLNIELINKELDRIKSKINNIRPNNVIDLSLSNDILSTNTYNEFVKSVNELVNNYNDILDILRSIEIILFINKYIRGVSININMDYVKKLVDEINNVLVIYHNNLLVIDDIKNKIVVNKDKYMVYFNEYWALPLIPNDVKITR